MNEPIEETAIDTAELIRQLCAKLAMGEPIEPKGEEHYQLSRLHAELQRLTPGPGELQIGINELGEVVINLDKDRTGHIVFSPDQARNLARVLQEKATEAAGGEENPAARREFFGLELRLSCMACPEQYDVFLKGELVGYMRLRHGLFRCDAWACGGPTVYQSITRGDGQFHRDERDKELASAAIALTNFLGLMDAAERYKFRRQEDVRKDD